MIELTDEEIMKQYTGQNVKTILDLRNMGKSVRAIAKFTGIPKSVVGRWVKDPDTWRQRYEASAVKTQIKDTKEGRLKQMEKTIREFIKKENPKQKRNLRITYDEEYDDYDIDTGEFPEES